MNPALIIFIKNPELGKAKTRLAATIGDENALQIYLQLLSITRTVATQTRCEKLLFYSSVVDENDDWPNDAFTKMLQSQGDLGEKMESAFHTAFERGNQPVIIIGSDCPTVTPALLEEAIHALSENDFVAGPADDGGYYLLGMRDFHPFVFREMQWSTSDVLNESLKRIRRENLKIHLLKTLTDIDDIHDLRKFPELFPGF